MKAIVLHSGGMDSSICLRLAMERHGREEILSLGFDYGQRNHAEIAAAHDLCARWGVERRVLDLSLLGKITKNSLTDHSLDFSYEQGLPNSFVVGRNGLMLRIAAIYGAPFVKELWTGVISEESYPDCSRNYMDAVEKALRIDLQREDFRIVTPLVAFTKEESYTLAQELGVLDVLIQKTITCYSGLPSPGCGRCAACILRNSSWERWKATSSLSQEEVRP